MRKRRGKIILRGGTSSVLRGRDRMSKELTGIAEKARADRTVWPAARDLEEPGAGNLNPGF